MLRTKLVGQKLGTLLVTHNYLIYIYVIGLMYLLL